MEIVFTVLILLLAVAASGIAARLAPFNLPLPLFQIGLGAILALPIFSLRIRFDPELFLLLFIPPLLFSEGWRTPKREFFRLAKPILALGLVLFTVVGIGYFIHWMISIITLPSAMVLAAVLSPTDAVAVSSIIDKTRLPPTMLHLLQGEALMNDASGLVAFNFAIVAVLSGTFSLLDASASFILIAIGGIAIGLIVAWSFGLIRRKVIEWSGDEPGIQIVLLLLIPFSAYIFAEHFGLSGTLSAVAAGMLMPYLETAKAESATTRLQSRSTFAMLEFVFNGMSFLLLGLQLPSIISLAQIDAQIAGDVPIWHLLMYIVAINAAFIALRFIWIWVNLRIKSFSAAIHGQHPQKITVNSRHISITALAGVRGAITLAGIMSIPLTLTNGDAFPALNLLIFLATGVILCSLLVGSFLLPLLLKNLPFKNESQRRRSEKMQAWFQISEAAIRGIEQTQKKLQKQLDQNNQTLLNEVSRSLLATYRIRMEAKNEPEETHQIANRIEQFEQELRLAAILAERKEAHRLRAAQQIDDQTFQAIIHKIDLAETGLLESFSAVH